MRGRTLSALFAAAMMITGAIAFAQSDPTPSSGLAGVTFPIAELGSCADKASCRAYCDDASHMNECVAFAESHGLMNAEEASRAKRFGETIATGSGPGGCTSPRACQEYCENVAHLDACMAFAEKNKFTGPEYAHGQKIRTYIKSGGSMPGGCTSRASCQAYCEDFNHAEECLAFAEAAGIMEDLGDDDGHDGSEMNMKREGPRGNAMPTREQMAKLAALAKNGETPGKCTSKASCEAYCHDGAHMEECMAFAEKMGFMSKEEASRARAFIEKGGPGGCKSEAECHAYCNAPENREMCFRFAEENGLIPPEEIERMKEGMVRMRQGLEQAPPEVRECLKSSLGETVIEDIQSGKLVPGPDIGERARSCFEKFGGAHDPSEVMRQAPAEVRACLNEKVGLSFEEITKREPTPEIADAFRVCFQQMQFRSGGEGSGAAGMRQGPNPEMLQGILRSAPPEVVSCLKEKLGDDLEKIAAGTSMPTPPIEEKMRACFESFRPAGVPNEAMHREGGTTATMPPTGSRMNPPLQGGTPGGNIPPEVVQCVKEKLGEEGAATMMRTGPTPETQPVVRACFEQFGKPSAGTMPAGMVPPPSGDSPSGIPGAMPPQGSAGWTSGLPPAVQTCLKAKFGDDTFVKIGMQPPTPEIEMAIRACFMTTQPQMPAGGVMPTDGQMPPPPTDSSTGEPTTQTRLSEKAFLGAVVGVLWDIVR